MKQTPFARLLASEFGANLPETAYLRGLFVSYATELFGVHVDELTEREVKAAHRAFLPFIVSEVGAAELKYILPVDWASAMVSDNPGFIADYRERECYLRWFGYIIVPAGNGYLGVEVQTEGPSFLCSCPDVFVPGFLDHTEKAVFIDMGNIPGSLSDTPMYWCQTVVVRFCS